MRIYTSITWNIETGAVLAHDFYEYVGAVEQCKKGRRTQEAIMKDQLAEMKREATEKWRQLGLAEPTIRDLEETTNIAPMLAQGAAIEVPRPPTDAQKLQEWFNQYMRGEGGVSRPTYYIDERGQKVLLRGSGSAAEATGGYVPVSRYAAAQMASERDDIARQFAGLRATAIRSLGARGLAPDRSGLARTSMNALARGESEAETGSFRNALANTLQQRMAALNARLGQRAEAGASSVRSGELSSTSALRRSQMGSTFGDVMGGIGQVAGIASDIFAPGSGMLRRKIGGGIKPGQASQIGYGTGLSGVGGY